MLGIGWQEKKRQMKPSDRDWTGHVHRVRKKRVWSISDITSSNTDRFLKFFHLYNLQEIRNKVVVTYPTTP